VKKRPKSKPDVNQRALATVRTLTGAEPVNGEDLIGDPELRRKFREAKAKDIVRRGR